MKHTDGISTELVGALYSRVGDFRALPELLGLVAENTDADAVRLGLDLGYGYRHDCYVGTALEAGQLDIHTPRPESQPHPAGWIDQRPLPVGTPGRRGAPRSDIAVLRNPEHPAFNASERNRLSLLIPHLNHAIRLAHELECSRQREACAYAALNYSDQGILLIDNQGIILHGNERARELIEHAGLRVARSLILPDRAQQGFYDNALVQASRPDWRTPIDVLLTASPPVLMRIHPPHRLNHAPAPLILTLRSQPSNPVPLSDALRHHFDLTPGEFRLCQALSAGQTLKHCAQAWNRSYDTLRSHLKSLLAKTGTHRQAELVALLEAFRER